jgi:hypothetical protein
MKKKQKFAIRTIVWRFLTCLYAPFLYTIDFFENFVIENEYADGHRWSFERTRVDFLRF